nr:hypothetical protein [Bacillus licheniformis]
MGNIKQRQKKMVDSAVLEIEKRIEEKGLLKNKILIVYIEGILNKNLTGLVANQLAN